MKKRLSIFLLVLLASIGAVFSHGMEEEYVLDHSGLYPLTQLQAFSYGSLAFGVLILIILLFHKKMNDIAKKLIYMLLVAVTASVTLYLILTTLHLNFISITKGPVHWHADFEIWACGTEIKLFEPEGLSNKQGTHLMHAHDDNRIHVEGVILDTKQASLGAFFFAVGGSLSDDGFEVPTDDGMISFHEGDNCNGHPGRLYVFVNGNLIDEPASYVIAPNEKVPPGDRVNFVFSELPIEEINPNIK